MSRAVTLIQTEGQTDTKSQAQSVTLFAKYCKFKEKTDGHIHVYLILHTNKCTSIYNNILV